MPHRDVTKDAAWKVGDRKLLLSRGPHEPSRPRRKHRRKHHTDATLAQTSGGSR